MLHRDPPISRPSKSEFQQQGWAFCKQALLYLAASPIVHLYESVARLRFDRTMRGRSTCLGVCGNRFPKMSHADFGRRQRGT